jgi:tetratricopeptide (TPR) repeat protein
MRAYVYTDKALERYAGRFVWLSINTESAKNAEFVGKYKIPALPTLLVIDPDREVVTLRYVGGATTGQLTKLLDDARAKSRGDADTTLADADRLAGEGKQEEAAKLYARAIEQAPKGWRRFGRAAESLVLALAMTGQEAECAKHAHALYPSLKGTTSGATVAATGLGCAAALKSANLVSILEKATRDALNDPKLDFSADDRSSLYLALADAREAAGDKEGAKKLTAEMASFLESAAAAAKTAEQRAVYDSYRLSAYLTLETPEKAIPMLEQSERDFPGDYNPPARLALAYKAMKKYDQALAASDRAMKLAYGPRKIGYYRTRADIFLEMGDKEGARKTMAEAVAYAKSLPKEQQRASTIASLEKRLAELK